MNDLEICAKVVGRLIKTPEYSGSSVKHWPPRERVPDDYNPRTNDAQLCELIRLLLDKGWELGTTYHPQLGNRYRWTYQFDYSKHPHFFDSKLENATIQAVVAMEKSK